MRFFSVLGTFLFSRHIICFLLPLSNGHWFILQIFMESLTYSCYYMNNYIYQGLRNGIRKTAGLVERSLVLEIESQNYHFSCTIL